MYPGGKFLCIAGSKHLEQTFEKRDGGKYEEQFEALLNYHVLAVISDWPHPVFNHFRSFHAKGNLNHRAAICNNSTNRTGPLVLGSFGAKTIFVGFVPMRHSAATSNNFT